MDPKRYNVVTLQWCHGTKPKFPSHWFRAHIERNLTIEEVREHTGFPDITKPGTYPNLETANKDEQAFEVSNVRYWNWDDRPTLSIPDLAKRLEECNGYRNFNLIINGNVDDEDVKFCINQARENGDTADVELGELLLKLSKTQRRKAAKHLC